MNDPETANLLEVMQANTAPNSPASRDFDVNPVDDASKPPVVDVGDGASRTTHKKKPSIKKPKSSICWRITSYLMFIIMISLVLFHGMRVINAAKADKCGLFEKVDVDHDGIINFYDWMEYTRVYKPEIFEIDKGVQSFAVAHEECTFDGIIISNDKQISIRALHYSGIWNAPKCAAALGINLEGCESPFSLHNIF